MSKPKAGYVLCDTKDAEERLEDACAYRALSDHWSLDVDTPYKNNQVFGRFSDAEQVRRGFRVFGNHHASEYLDDPCFIAGANRDFQITDLNGASRFHDKYGEKSFMKLPQFKMTLPLIGNFSAALGDMGYSLTNGEKCLIQELLLFENEWRFFVIDGEIITWGKCETHLTPIHHPQREPVPESLLIFASKMAKLCEKKSTTLDIGWTKKGWTVVELNPFDFGRCGLYDCDVIHLASAISQYCIDNPAPPSDWSDMSMPQHIEYMWNPA